MQFHVGQDFHMTKTIPGSYFCPENCLTPSCLKMGCEISHHCSMTIHNNEMLTFTLFSSEDFLFIVTQCQTTHMDKDCLLCLISWSKCGCLRQIKLNMDHTGRQKLYYLAHITLHATRSPLFLYIIDKRKVEIQPANHIIRCPMPSHSDSADHM